MPVTMTTNTATVLMQVMAVRLAMSPAGHGEQRDHGAALTLTLSQTGRIDRLSNGVCRSSDFRAVHERMAPFIAAGFHAVCGGRKRK